MTKCKRSYQTFTYPNSKPGDQTILTGIRQVRNSSKVFISGFYIPVSGTPISFVYKGCINGKGTFNNLNYPLANTITNLYGPNNGINGSIQVVGNYTNELGTFGCLYEGDLNGSGTWITIVPPNAINTICHSTMGNLIVGNYNTEPDLTISKAFIYDIKTFTYYDIINPVNSLSTIYAYGIWHNHNQSYTICGGYSTDIINVAYVADWDNNTHTMNNYQAFVYENNPLTALKTHFNGISGIECHRYSLVGDWIGIASINNEIGFFAVIKRDASGNFYPKAKWTGISFANQLITSGNSVSDSTVVGVYTNGGDNVNGYVSYLK